MNYYLKNCLFLLFFFPMLVYAQFPYLKGKSASGILQVTSGGSQKINYLNFDFSSSRLSLNNINQIEDSEMPDESGLPDDVDRFTGHTSYITSIGVDLNEGVFNLFDGDFNFGFDISFTENRVVPLKGNLEQESAAYFSYYYRPLLESTLLKFAEVNPARDGVNTFTKFNHDMGIDLGGAFYKNDKGTKYFLSYSNFVGLGFNHNASDKKKEVCTVEQTLTGGNTTHVIQTCDNRIFNPPSHAAIGKMKFDWGLRLGSFDGNGNDTQTESPALYIIGRLSSDVDLFKWDFKNNALVGLLISRTNRQPLASITVQMRDIGSLNEEDTSIEDVLSARLAFGVPF